MINDAVASWTSRNHDGFELRLHRSFPAAPTYIEVFAITPGCHWERVRRPNFLTGGRVVVFFHSIPVATDKTGDPYRVKRRHMVISFESHLGLVMDFLIVIFQSVFGRAKWLGPQTIEGMTELSVAECPYVDVICPGLMADYPGTLKEINQLNRETFVGVRGEDFRYAPWGDDLEGVVVSLEEQTRITLVDRVQTRVVTVDRWTKLSNTGGPGLVAWRYGRV